MQPKVRKGQFGVKTGFKVHNPNPRKLRTRRDQKQTAIKRSKEE